MNSHALVPTRRLSNTPVRDTLIYDMSLEISRCDRRSCGNDGFHVYPLGSPFSPGELWDAHIPLGEKQVYNAVEDTLRVWHDKVIHLDLDVDGITVKPYQREWDLAGRSDLLDTIGPQVAQAGQAMFYQLFQKGGDDLTKLADRLLEVMTARPVKMRILSDDFFVPWGLFYFAPDKPAGPRTLAFWDGFWGARHVIDHETRIVGPKVVIDGARRMPIAVAVDENLPVSVGGDTMQIHLDFFRDRPPLDVQVWRNKCELQTGLSGDPLAQVILYFCCHGQAGDDVGPPNIRLTDQEPIQATEIDFWLRRHNKLATHPVVFLNACEGGLMQTRLYETIAPQFLRREAAGLIGAHTQLPTIFATSYAQVFFERLLRQPSEKVRIGPLMNQLARLFIEDHCNPLGLVYALYRASDVYVCWDGKETR